MESKNEKSIFELFREYKQFCLDKINDNTIKEEVF